MQITDSNIILNMQNLSCGYGANPVLEGFNLRVIQGDCIAITGPNGCGKSTLLKAIYQLCIINKGNIFYKGESLIGKTPEQIKKMGIAYFMQKNAIFPKLSVKENLLLSLNGMSKQHKKTKEEEIISNFPEIGTWLTRPAGLLSGGQRQQLAMSMLLSQDANLWLLDEPAAGLDVVNSDKLLELIIKYAKKTSNNPKTIILAEHKANIINILADSIISL